METSRKTGLWGEIYAARYLREKGCRIISANYRTRFGEVDIIARNKKYICFVEVKTRGEGAIAQPKEAVDLSKQKKIVAASELFMKTYKYRLQPRYDVCELWLDENFSVKKINYIENAFEV